VNQLGYRIFDACGVFVLLGFGAFLLRDAISQSGPSSVAEVIGGSTLLSLGLVLLYAEWVWFLRWRRAVRVDDQHHLG
jgi:protein-S-isoprenylcysteine O-methyltransferase Ste14